MTLLRRSSYRYFVPRNGSLETEHVCNRTALLISLFLFLGVRFAVRFSLSDSILDCLEIRISCPARTKVQSSLVAMIMRGRYVLSHVTVSGTSSRRIWHARAHAYSKNREQPLRPVLISFRLASREEMLSSHACPVSASKGSRRVNGTVLTIRCRSLKGIVISRRRR